jgi:HEAT repeat protein
MELLHKRDIDGLASLAGQEPKVIRVLLSLLLETEDLTRWRAIQGIGAIAAIKAQSNSESVPDLLRRLLWSMNDESGNVGWHAPEAIGEILACVPSLIDEFGPILFAYLREEPFERGSHWALARISWVKPDTLIEYHKTLFQSLDDSDPFIRAHAAISLCVMGSGSAKEKIKDLSGDKSAFSIFDYRSGKMEDLTVGQVAGAILRHPVGSVKRPAYLYELLGKPCSKP